MNIVTFPNPFLSTKTYEITVFGEELKTLLDSMYETMKANNGIGLAANQVGLLHRMFVMEGLNGRLNIVNPVIVNRSVKVANMKEGCLSAPGEFIVVPSRVEWIDIQSQNEKGESQRFILKGIRAVCALHEIDHLDGKIFMSDKSISKNERKRLAKKWGIK